MSWLRWPNEPIRQSDEPQMSRRFHLLEGIISSVGFSSGDRLVIGDWRAGPIGPMVDVMWADPVGRRTLIAADHAIARFVSAVYTFDDIQVDETLRSASQRGKLRITSDRLDVDLVLGRSVRIPFRRLRTPLVTRYIERPIARRLMNVHTFGVTSAGMHEWYQADRVWRVAEATATLNATPLGTMTTVRPPLNVGFSEPPPWPSSVAVRPRLHDPSGRLDVIVDELNEQRFGL
jgi:hypothetical protein